MTKNIGLQKALQWWWRDFKIKTPMMVSIMRHNMKMCQWQVDEMNNTIKVTKFGDLRLFFQQYLLFFSWIQIIFMVLCIHLRSNEMLNQKGYVRLILLSPYNTRGLLASIYSSDMKPK